MAEVFGRVESTEVTDGKQITNFRIPAMAQNFAEQRASANIRLKGLTNGSITDVQQIDQGSIPGQKIYEVTVESDR